jgi:hypothetical protein
VHMAEIESTTGVAEPIGVKNRGHCRS